MSIRIKQKLHRGKRAAQRTAFVGSIFMCAVLSACSAIAPGMRMEPTTSLPVAGPSPSAPVTQVNVPYSEIDVSLISQLESADGVIDPAQLTHLMSPAAPYTLGPGDVLQITVWDHPELVTAISNQNNPGRAADAAPGFIVDQRGNIQFPYVGNLLVAGLTPEEAQRALFNQLNKAFKDPQVTLRVASFRAKSVYVDGEVKAPGLQQLNDIPMTILEAVSRSGGFTPDADQGRLKLLRNGKSYTIDLTALVNRGINPASIVLQPADVLKVAGREDNGVFVMGEVTKPLRAIPEKSGRLTLSQALAQAGSINSNTADARQLYVIRGAKSATPHIYHLDAHSPVAMTLANDFPLQPNDVVYVDGNGLVRLSRILSLLLPSLDAGLYTFTVAK
ncbi:polysaccharide export outer membrane protein [Paraburkholderia sp. GAS199]|uniref:polysaccharide biosynthesis/export family protein n=1 Tax=Paraburkholderia sp. GAS199 TaxID=3035126 RepID=UPI003D254469